MTASTVRSGGSARPHLSPVVWRSAAVAPLVLVGGGAKVRALMVELQDRLGERQVVSMDLWVRTEGVAIGGARQRLVKRSLVMMVGVGDIEQSRVCPSLCLSRLPPARTWDRGRSFGVSGGVHVRLLRTVAHIGYAIECEHAQSSTRFCFRMRPCAMPV